MKKLKNVRKIIIFIGIHVNKMLGVRCLKQRMKNKMLHVRCPKQRRKNKMLGVICSKQRRQNKMLGKQQRKRKASLCFKGLIGC